MLRRTKSLYSGTVMALLAIVSLFVSPVLAIGCCCDDVSPVVPQGAAHQPQCADHHQSAAGGQPHCSSLHQATGPDGIACNAAPDEHPTIGQLCGCTVVTSDLAFVPAGSAHFPAFSAPVGALPEQQSLALCVADASVSARLNQSARPRGPALSVAAGRAPPLLATS